MRRSTAGAAAAAIGAATAVTALVIGATTGSAATGVSEAFGVSVEGDLVNVPKTPHVESDGSETKSDELLEVPGDPLLHARVLGVDAGDNVAAAEVADVTVGGQLNASVIEVSCEGTSGQTTIVGLEIPGQDFEQKIQPEPNTTIVPDQLGNVAQITLNRQTQNDDGSFTVDGVVVDLVDGTQVVVVSSATCAGDGGADDGGVDDGGVDNGGADNGGVDDGGADGGADDGGADGGADNGGPGATKPAPITTGLPVTG